LNPYDESFGKISLARRRAPRFRVLGAACQAPRGLDSRLELERAIMRREKTLRYVLIAVGALILALLALQFWVVKKKKYIFQGSVSAASAGPPGRLLRLLTTCTKGKGCDRVGPSCPYPGAVPPGA
jgi:hypothetical protein